MNNKMHKMSGLSALPLLIILGLIFGAGYFLLKGNIDLSFLEQSNKLEMERLENFPTTVGVSENLDKQRVVIRSEDDLIDFLSYVDKSKALSVSEKIDFDKTMLIGVSTKTFDTGGYSIKIEKIYIDKEENKLLVSSMITKPGDNCITDQVLTSAVDLVAIDKTDMEIDFELKRQTNFCKE